MDNRGKLLTCLAFIMIFGSLVAGSTYALYESERTVNQHLITGDFKAGLYLESLQKDYLDANGLIATETVDLTQYSEYETDKGVNLVDYKGDVFTFDGVIPTMTSTATFAIYNTGNVAFQYSAEIVGHKGYVYDSETSKYVESSGAAILSQIETKIVTSEGQDNVVNPNEKVTFEVTCEFKDLPNNNEAMNQQFAFDILVKCIQVVKSS